MLHDDTSTTKLVSPALKDETSEVQYIEIDLLACILFANIRKNTQPGVLNFGSTLSGMSAS